MNSIFSCILFFITGLLFAQVPVSPNGKFIKINDANIYYEEFGQGEPLLLLHGFGRTLEDWKPYIDDFAKTYRVIAWDMRGHGRSSSPYSGEVFLHANAAKDLISFMDSLNLKTIKTIGHSSGGVIILNAACDNPERFEKIIPISAQIYFSAQTRKFIEEEARPEMYYVFNELENQHGKEKGKLLANQFHYFHKLDGDPSISTEQLSRIKAKTLIVHGDNDFIPISHTLEIYQNIKNSNLWIVPNGWHLPHAGSNVEWFIKTALKFLDQK